MTSRTAVDKKWNKLEIKWLRALFWINSKKKLKIFSWLRAMFEKSWKCLSDFSPNLKKNKIFLTPRAVVDRWKFKKKTSRVVFDPILPTFFSFQYFDKRLDPHLSPAQPLVSFIIHFFPIFQFTAFRRQTTLPTPFDP